MSNILIFILIIISIFIASGILTTLLIFWSYNKQKKISKNIFLFMDDPINYEQIKFDPKELETQNFNQKKYTKYLLEGEVLQFVIDDIEVCNEIVQYSNKLDLINEQNTRKIIDGVYFVDSKNMHDEFVEKDKKIEVLVTNKNFHFIIFNGKKIISYPLNKLDRIIFLVVGFCCIAKLKLSTHDDITLFIDSKDDVQKLIKLVKIKQHFSIKPKLKKETVKVSTKKNDK